MKETPIIIKAGSVLNLSTDQMSEGIDRFTVMKDFDIIAITKEIGVDISEPAETVKEAYLKQMRLTEYLITNGFVKLSSGDPTKAH